MHTWLLDCFVAGLFVHDPKEGRGASFPTLKGEKRGVMTLQKEVQLGQEDQSFCFAILRLGGFVNEFLFSPSTTDPHIRSSDLPKDSHQDEKGPRYERSEGAFLDPDRRTAIGDPSKVGDLLDGRDHYRCPEEDW